ncbi:MAG: NAD-dependent deacylase [Gammaproteobacteria bacterium]|nr:NAD-dependent deacylase [Gammaproteobacteria bacterium]MBT8111114.1 NAD-dependent deacylase [Gammaproteobacteria bacterium]NND48031.1 NAD-dependent deacylase [Woeseiaceae bacterium]NNL45812.1 NAD-dependent deacylase [Woeseiaceae bacterium]
MRASDRGRTEVPFEKSRYDPGLITALRDARNVCVLTGAGISAESGVPTFRDAQKGLWARYDPHQLATPEAFEENPELLWRWYRWRRELVAAANPNPGHLALVRLAELVPRLTLVTQNVDGLHQRAGSRDVIEFHGNLFDDRCHAEGCVVVNDQQAAVPVCPNCGANLRPGVVWFGEAIPDEALEQSFAAAADCSVFLSIGTSSLVYPAAGLADVARETHAIVAEINPNPTLNSETYDFAIAGNAGVVLPELVESLAT